MKSSSPRDPSGDSESFITIGEKIVSVYLLSFSASLTRGVLKYKISLQAVSQYTCNLFNALTHYF